MLHLALKAFYPEKTPFPFMHIDTTCKFKEMIKFRDHVAQKYGLDMIVYSNEEGIKNGINPFDHGSAYTDIMKTQAWDSKNQRPEMWKLYNTQIHKGESMRVFPLSNWTEKDIWQYIKRENIEIVSLYSSAVRPIVHRDENIIMVDDDRLKLRPGEKIENVSVRFRTLGFYPLTGGVESTAVALDEIIDETLSSVTSERTSRVIDKDGGAASMEKRNREGYF